jgi:hypothetical protein
MAIGRLAAHVSGMKPVKRSVAGLIRNGDFIFSTRRPDHDDELPGVWDFQPVPSVEPKLCRT